MLQIDTVGRIIINKTLTGVGVRQRPDCTEVYLLTLPEIGQQYEVLKMPQRRYSTAHPAPDSGVAGCDQLEADIVAVLAERQLNN
jgi:hypothetical protein